VKPSGARLRLRNCEADLPWELLAQHASEQFDGIDTHRFGNGDEFRYVHLALVALDHSDDRVRPAQQRCEVSLRKFFPQSGAGYYRSDGLSRRTS
jgi:hypothetical protein